MASANLLQRMFPYDIVYGYDLNPIIEAIDGGRIGVVTVVDTTGTTTVTGGAIAVGVIGPGALGAAVPGVPAGVGSTSGIDLNAQVNNIYYNLTWTANPSTDYVVSYEIKYRKAGDSVYYYQRTGTNSVKISGLFPAQAYGFSVRAQNNIGNWSAYATEYLPAAVIDTVAPAIPTGLTAYKTPRGAYVTWNANTEADLQGYIVQVTLNGGTSWTNITPGATLATALPYVLNGAGPGQALQFRIQAIDWTGNSSLFSSASTALTVDGVKFDELIAGNLTVLGTISGLGGIQTGSSGQRVVMDVNGLRMYSPSSALLIDINANGSASLSGTINSAGLSSGTITGTTFQTSSTVGQGVNGNGVMIDSTNGLRIFNSSGVATMTASIAGAVSLTGSINSGSTINGAAITGGTLAIGSGNAILKADSSGLYLGNAVFASAPFRVDMNGNLTATSATITGTLASGSTIGSGVVTPPSLASTVPGVPTGVGSTAGIDYNAQVNNVYYNLTWTANVAGDYVVSYEVKVRKAGDTVYYYYQTGTNSIKLSGFIPNQAYGFFVRAQNNLGIWSSYTTEYLPSTVTDTTAPATPTGVTATQSPRGAFVTWNGNTELDLQGYHVQYQLGGGAWTDLTAGGGLMLSTATSYIAPAGTANGTAIGFRVSAVDWSGNPSTYSVTGGAAATTIALVATGDLSVTVGGANVVPNSSFQDDSNNPGVTANGWLLYNNSQGLEPATTTIQATGGFGDNLKFWRTTWGVVNTTVKGTYTTGLPPWMPNKTYMVSFYAKSPALTATMGLQWNTAPQNTYTIANPALTTAWQRYIFRIVWGASVPVANELYISITNGWPDFGSLDIDAVQVELGDVVTAYAPKTDEILTGVVGLTNLSTITPAIPTGLAGTTGIDASGQVNNVYINTTWSANAASDKVAAYEVRYRKSGDTLYYYATTGQTALKLTGLIASQVYQISIRAQNTLGNYSAYTTEISVTGNAATAPATPGTVTATGFPRGISLSWPANTEADLQGYQVQVSSVNPSPGPAVWSTVMTTALQTSFLYQAPAGTVQGTPYWFQVRAINWANQPSGYTAAATASTLAVTNSDIVVNSIIVDKLAAGNLSVTATIIAGGKIVIGNPPAAAGIQIDTTGLKAYNSSGTNTVSINSDGTASFTGSITSGATITGATITGGTISIGTSPNWFNADASGIWLGGATFGASPFRVSQAGTVTATNIIAQVQAGSSLPTGIVGAAQIVANAVTTDKLTVGSLNDNALLNGSFEDVVSGGTQPTSWQNGPDGTGGTWTRASDQIYDGAYSLKISVSGGNTIYQGVSSYQIPVAVGERWQISGWTRADAATTSVIRLAWADKTGAQIANTDAVFAPLPAINTWYYYSANSTAPANAAFIFVYLYNYHPTTSANCWFDGMKLQRLVVNGFIDAGTITADRLVAGTITASSAVIANAAITSAQIISLVADKITVGNLLATVSITSGLFQTAGSGARIVFDSTSIRTYDGGSTNYGAPSGAGVTTEFKNDGTAFLKGTVTSSGFKGGYVYGTTADTNVPSLPSVPITNGVGTFMLDPVNGLRFWSANGSAATLNAQITPAGAVTINAGANLTVSGGTISGTAITGGSLAIGSANAILKADANGLYLGNATFASAPFRVDMNGNLTATAATITGAITATSGTFTGTINASGGTFAGTITASGTISGGTITGAGYKGGYVYGTTADGALTLPTPPVTLNVGTFMLDPANGLRFWKGDATTANLNTQFDPVNGLRFWSGNAANLSTQLDPVNGLRFWSGNAATLNVQITPVGAITIYSGANFTVTGGKVYAGTIQSNSTIGAAADTGNGYKITGAEIGTYAHDAGGGTITTAPVSFYADTGGTWHRIMAAQVAAVNSVAVPELVSLGNLYLYSGFALDGQTVANGTAVVIQSQSASGGQVQINSALIPLASVSGHNVPVLLARTTTGADAATIDIAIGNSGIDLTHYSMVEVRFWTLASAAGDVGLRLGGSSDGAPDSGNNYDYVGMESNGVVSGVGAINAASYCRVGANNNANTYPTGMTIRIYNTNDTGHHQVAIESSQMRIDSQTGMYIGHFGGKWRGSATNGVTFVEFIRLVCLGGNFKSGAVVQCWGYA